MNSSFYSTKVVLLLVLSVLTIQSIDAQTKRIKRPSSRVGSTNIDKFVRESFDLYDKVYTYDGYAEAGKPLDDSDIDVLEDALDDLIIINESAPNILSEVDKLSMLKKGKATLQLNKTQKALKYSIKTAKKLLANNKRSEDGESDSDNDETDDDANSGGEDDDSSNNSGNDSDDESGMEEEESNVSDNLEAYSKFDFVPGDELLFYDDFSQDFIGDFPSKWNTNASGEVVRFNNIEGNWFELKSGYGVYFVPDLEGLPEDYTIEFDVVTRGLSRQSSSTARLHIILSDSNKFNTGVLHYARVTIPAGQYGAFSLRANNYFNRGGGDVNTDIKADIRDEILNQPHISISVTKKRYRLWINEVKYVDIPRFIQELNVLNYLKFHINNFKDGEEQLYISNLKVAKGGVDLRRKLLSEGRISTNGILFDSGSANIQPQSYGIIRQISQVLLQDSSLRLNIIGHTDADGNDDTNMKLSKDRADAVKNALIKIYKISGERLETDGKGESDPVGDNNTTDGKAQNRRVEFVKM
jgi:outer membrane protein OmpA-like peptidoglycan-associated protein